MTTATTPYLGAPPAPQAPQTFQIPPAPHEIQTLELEGGRWRNMRAMLHANVAKLAALLGCELNVIPAEDSDGEKGVGLSRTDELRYSDGTADMDFEESSIEVLGRFERECAEAYETAKRFRWNLQTRSHDPIQVEAEQGEQQA